MYGKVKENRKVGQKFSEWVQEMFPGLHPNTAADAIWYGSNSIRCMEISTDLTHPHHMRQAVNDQDKLKALDAVLPTELQDIAPVAAAQWFAENSVVATEILT